MKMIDIVIAVSIIMVSGLVATLIFTPFFTPAINLHNEGWIVTFDIISFTSLDNKTVEVSYDPFDYSFTWHGEECDIEVTILTSYSIITDLVVDNLTLSHLNSDTINGTAYYGNIDYIIDIPYYVFKDETIYFSVNKSEVI